MKINVERYSITDLTQEEINLLVTAICHFPTNHAKSSEVFALLDKFAVVADVESWNEENKR